jgi:hypothetical protein
VGPVSPGMLCNLGQATLCLCAVLPPLHHGDTLCAALEHSTAPPSFYSVKDPGKRKASLPSKYEEERAALKVSSSLHTACHLAPDRATPLAGGP